MGYFTGIFLDFIKSHPMMAVINICFMALTPVNDVLLPHLYGKLVESIRTGKNFNDIFIYIMMVITIVQIGSVLFDLHDTVFNPVFQSYLRLRMLNTIFDKYNNAYDELSIGSIITTMIKAPGILLVWYSRVKDYMLPHMLVFLSATLYFMYYDVTMGVLLVLLLAALIFFMVISPRGCENQAIKKAQLYAAMYEEVDDVLRNLLSIYTSNKMDAELSRLKGVDNDHQKACITTMTCALFYKFLSFPLIIIFFAVFIYRSYYLVRKGVLPVASFVSLLMIFIGILNNLMWIVDIMRDVIIDSGYLKEADSRFAILANAKPISDYNLPLTPPFEDGIGLYNVSFTYEKNKDPVLDGTTIHFAPGERAIIAGPIGSGKSTISKLLEKLYMPSSGDLYINGRWYHDMSTVEVRNHVGYVPQQPVLFNRSVYENIMYGNDPIKINEAYVDKLLKDLKIEDEFINLSDGLHTKIGKNGSKLSGGQRQLVWCIRTLIRNPEVVILDEPTASMDEKTKKVLERIVDMLMTGKTVIMITHDDYLLKKATRIVRLPIDKHRDEEIAKNDSNIKFDNW